MIVEILTVGTEILMGEITNTNAQYISRRLSEVGAIVQHQTTVGDNPRRLTQAFLQAWQRSDAVILTGGLGPTQDDLTKETVAAALCMPLVLHAPSLRAIEEFFRASGRAMAESNRKQAMFPEGCLVMENPNGTAPGCLIHKDGKLAAILPGPPREMKPMFERYVAPQLAKRVEGKLHVRMVRVFGMGESDIETRVGDLIAAQQNPTIAPYAGFGEVRLRLCASAETERQANALLDPVEAELRNRLGAHVYAVDELPMEGVVANLLLQTGVRVSVAESLTGGQVASGLVAYPGVSACLMEGVVCYSNQSKTLRLGVPEQMLKTHGAVSAQTALAMCDGLLATRLCEVAVSTTGVAGPSGGTREKPVGCVYIAVAGKAVRYARRFVFGGGDRDRIRRWSTMHAYNFLRLYLLGQDIAAFYGDDPQGRPIRCD